MRSAFSLSIAAFVALASAQIPTALPDGISLEDLPSNIAELIPTALPSEIPTDLPDNIASLIPSGLLSSATQSAATPTGSSTSDSGSLPSLVEQLPTCAVGCLNTAASDIGCAATDFSCLCGKSTELISSITGCLTNSSQSGCSLNQAIEAGRVAPQICERINNNPSSQEIASASSLVAGAIETGAATTTGGTGNNDDSGAAHVGVGAALLASLMAMAVVF
ncbi:hypothetical protein B0T11DRAFT_276027 [Plectosphaerella cucumerina]|uniref:CFEM domain-containing protein n=1 Tax=Plectosphaerella cucumerina TaxID=40658 RepID=A0A8K0X7C7_9PEZI|nr:hypothetical protein B0T11DRAFT_276027 [Plectosphaerella cucumerina]